MTARFALVLAGWITVVGLVQAQEMTGPAALPIPGAGSPSGSLIVSGSTPISDVQDDGSRIWASAEYLLWWFKDSPVPVPLVTDATSILLGGRSADTDVHSGGRFTIGGWLNDDHSIGAEANYLYLGVRSRQQFVSAPGTPGTPVLNIPFFDVTIPGGNFAPLATSTPPAGLLPFSGIGILTVATRLDGTEVNGVLNLGAEGRWRWEALAGFRYLHVDEDLTFRTASDNNVPPADVFVTSDEFRTSNNFYGGQVGARAEGSCGMVFVNTALKVALGGVSETAHVAGFTSTNFLGGAVGPVQTFPAGYFAEPTNSGRFHQTSFAVVPEVDLNIGLQLTEGVRIFAGYTFLYASNMARPGNQIDPVINPTQSVAFFGKPPAVPPTGPALPAFQFHESEFWTQGINFGLDFRF